MAHLLSSPSYGNRNTECFSLNTLLKHPAVLFTELLFTLNVQGSASDSSSEPSDLRRRSGWALGGGPQPLTHSPASPHASNQLLSSELVHPPSPCLLYTLHVV